jgi:hypothetical protein
LSNYKRHELLDHIQKVIDYKHDWRKAVQEGKSLPKWNGKLKSINLWHSIFIYIQTNFLGGSF